MVSNESKFVSKRIHVTGTGHCMTSCRDAKRIECKVSTTQGTSITVGGIVLLFQNLSVCGSRILDSYWGNFISDFKGIRKYSCEFVWHITHGYLGLLSIYLDYTRKFMAIQHFRTLLFSVGKQSPNGLIPVYRGHHCTTSRKHTGHRLNLQC